MRQGERRNDALQGIPENYLRQLFVALRRNGVVKAINGPKGGYLLLRNPAGVSALEVVLATGEVIEPTDQELTASGGRRARSDPTLILWHRVADAMREALGAVSIQQLAFPPQPFVGIPHGYTFDI